MQANLLRTLLLLCFAASNLSWAQNSEPNTRGFDHIGLSVNKLDASTSFFTETLGWSLRGGDPSYPANFVSDGHMFITLWATDRSKKAVEFSRKHNVGLHHLAIRMSSFEALEQLYQKLKKRKDVVIEFAPELAYGGPAKHMMIREPSGNRLEFKYSPQ